MSSYNSITIVGNCGKEPEMRFSQNGNAVTTFSVAVDNGRYVNEAWKEETEWFRVSCFNKLAERVNEKIAKGTSVLVVGKLKLSHWKDRDGADRTSLEILANNVMGLSKSEKAYSNAPVDDVEPPEGDIDPEDIPF